MSLPALRWMMLALKKYETLLGEDWQDTMTKFVVLSGTCPTMALTSPSVMNTEVPLGPRTPEGDAVARFAYWFQNE